MRSRSIFQFFITAVFVFLALGSAANADVRACDNIFFENDSAIRARPALEDLAGQLLSLPGPGRPVFANAFFTDQAMLLLKGERISLARALAVSSARRRVIAYARGHLEKLEALVRQDQSEFGNVTELTLVRIGYHLSRLNTYRLNRSRIDFDDVDAGFFERARSLEDDLLFFPITGEVSIEELTTWLANGVAPLGLIRSTIKADGTGFLPDGFYIHDFNHGTDYLSVLKNIEERSGGRALQRIKDRFQWLTVELKKLPADERKAGFTVLFYLTHEDPGAGLLKALSYLTPPIEFEFRERDRSDFIYRLSRRHDLAGEDPRSLHFWSKKEAAAFSEAGEKVLQTLLTNLPIQGAP